MGGLIPFPPAVCALADTRDSIATPMGPVAVCQWCGRPGEHRHHRRGKAAGGSTAPHTQCACNALTMCSPCHDWAHRRGRAAAGDAGLIVSQAQPLPAAVPVLRFGIAAGRGQRRWPSCTGTWDTQPPGEAA